VATVIILFLLFALGPLANINFHSFQPQFGSVKPLTLEWYVRAMGDHELNAAVQYSVLIGLVVGLIGMIFGFLGALTWWSPRQRNILLVAEFVCAFSPGEAHALGLADVLALLRLPTSGFVPIVIAHLIWALPFATIINMIGMSYISRSVIDAASGLSGRFGAVLRIVAPLVFPSLVSSFLVGLLLSFNESSRVYFLSAAQQTIGQFARGKMRSGMDPTAEAMASIDVMFGVVILVLVALGILRTHRANSRSVSHTTIATA
jgi:spermidine/putrescine transport system permease protein